MSHKIKLVLTLDLGILGERDAYFLISYIPATRDVMYLSNGDPGYPGDPAEVEILSAKMGDIDITALLPEDEDLLDRLCVEADEVMREEWQGDEMELLHKAGLNMGQP